jgi:hypothetical protein
MKPSLNEEQQGQREEVDSWPYGKALGKPLQYCLCKGVHQYLASLPCGVMGLWKIKRLYIKVLLKCRVLIGMKTGRTFCPVVL